MLIVWYSDSIMFLLFDEKELQQSKLKLTGNHLGFCCCCRLIINLSDISHDQNQNLHFHQVHFLKPLKAPLDDFLSQVEKFEQGIYPFRSVKQPGIETTSISKSFFFLLSKKPS